MNIKEKLDLLGIKEITTRRQMKNGTIILELPILKYGSKIQVGSFQSGYVRRMNGGYTPYQLNKCEGVDHYYKAYEWTGEEQKWTGKYNKFVGKRRILIPNEVDRLEYLISFCLKNYYINQANEIENGNFITKWKHEYEMKNGSMDRVRELQDEIRRNSDLISVQRARIEELQYKVMKYEKTVRELHEEIDMISEEKDNMDRKFEETAMELDELHVTVNGHKYKVI